MTQKIINPKTGRKVNKFGKIGMKILKNKLKLIQFGGNILGRYILYLSGGFTSKPSLRNVEIFYNKYEIHESYIRYSRLGKNDKNLYFKNISNIITNNPNEIRFIYREGERSREYVFYIIDQENIPSFYNFKSFILQISDQTKKLKNYYSKQITKLVNLKKKNKKNNIKAKQEINLLFKNVNNSWRGLQNRLRFEKQYQFPNVPKSNVTGKPSEHK